MVEVVVHTNNEIEKRLRDWNGAQVDLTDTVSCKFLASAIALRVYTALNLGDPDKYKEIHDAVMWTLRDLAAAKVRIG